MEMIVYSRKIQPPPPKGGTGCCKTHFLSFSRVASLYCCVNFPVVSSSLLTYFCHLFDLIRGGSAVRSISAPFSVLSFGFFVSLRSCWCALKSIIFVLLLRRQIHIIIFGEHTLFSCCIGLGFLDRPLPVVPKDLALRAIAKTLLLGAIRVPLLF